MVKSHPKPHKSHPRRLHSCSSHTQHPTSHAQYGSIVVQVTPKTTQFAKSHPQPHKSHPRRPHGCSSHTNTTTSHTQYGSIIAQVTSKTTQGAHKMAPSLVKSHRQPHKSQPRWLHICSSHTQKHTSRTKEAPWLFKSHPKPHKSHPRWLHRCSSHMFFTIALHSYRSPLFAHVQPRPCKPKCVSPCLCCNNSLWLPFASVCACSTTVMQAQRHSVLIFVVITIYSYWSLPNMASLLFKSHPKPQVAPEAAS